MIGKLCCRQDAVVDMWFGRTCEQPSSSDAMGTLAPTLSDCLQIFCRFQLHNLRNSMAICRANYDQSDQNTTNAHGIAAVRRAATNEASPDAASPSTTTYVADVGQAYPDGQSLAVRRTGDWLCGDCQILRSNNEAPSSRPDSPFGMDGFPLLLRRL